MRVEEEDVAGIVELPQNFTLKAAREGQVYGIETGDLGVERLVRYHIGRD